MPCLQLIHICALFVQTAGTHGEDVSKGWAMIPTEVQPSVRLWSYCRMIETWLHYMLCRMGLIRPCDCVVRKLICKRDDAVVFYQFFDLALDPAVCDRGA